MARSRRRSTTSKINALERRVSVLSDTPGVIVTTRQFRSFVADVVEILLELSKDVRRADETADRALRGPYAE